jgi:antitoxin component of MazEF toxin-antitoxin module
VTLAGTIGAMSNCAASHNLPLSSMCGKVEGVAHSHPSGVFVRHVYHVKLGENRRLEIPAALCRQLDLKPGEQLLLTQEGNRLAITSLRRQAEQMRQELREMVSEGNKLTDDLKTVRQTEAAREKPSRR